MRPGALAALGLGVAALALGACGNRAELKPGPGQRLIPVAAGEQRPKTEEELTTPSTVARPARSDELLRRSENRPNDDFDLPPS